MGPREDSRRNLPARIRDRVRAEGIPGALRYAAHLLSERIGDRRLGISTRGRIPLSRFGIHDTRCKPYAPVAYRSFRAVMRRVPSSPDDEFLDLGCGMGRIVILAALLPLRRVVGVEIVPELAAIARENLRRARVRLHCRELEIVTADAAGFAIPDGITLVHLFDPFRDEILDSVLRNIHASWSRRRRRITILFADPGHFEPVLPAHPWIRKLGRVPYAYAPRWQEKGSLRYEYGIYVVDG